MPRNKRDIEREVKVDEVLAAAEALFLRNGYSGTTVAAIAKQAGVSTNVLYWYFSSKDDIFVAVLDRHLVTAEAQLAARRGRSLVEQMQWVQKQLETLDPMTGEIHERALESEVVADFHERFHRSVQGFLLDGLIKEGMSQEDASKTAATLMAIVEAPRIHQKSRKERAELTMFVLGRLLPAGLVEHGS